MSFGSKSLPPPTEAEQDRMTRIVELGCIVSRLRGRGKPAVTEIHHLLNPGTGGRRRGHAFTIGLNPWTHRGQPFGNLTPAQCEDAYGPSLAQSSKRFKELFGSDDELLEMQNAMLAAAGFVYAPAAARERKRKPSSKIIPHPGRL